MSQLKEAIERGISLYQDLIAESSPLAREYEASRRDFQVRRVKDDGDSALSDRRHLEWFLLERPSPCLSDVPVHALRDQWRERADAVRGDPLPDADVYQHSFCGVFEVTSREPGRGLWLLDLFATGAYPVEEPEASVEVHAGDLFVGRIFPVGEGVHRASPAVQLFRDSHLLEAVRRDLDQLRASRRGVLRIEQVEIERLFFHGGESALGDGPPEDLAAERVRVREALLHAGIDPDLVDVVLAEIAASTRSGERDLTDILNALAFTDDVDLAAAQHLLSGLWSLETSRSPDASVGEDEAPQNAGNGAAKDARSSLEAFDLRRAAGADTGTLFDKFASELGFADAEEEGEEITLPDFPGVVGAMVEEFLWEVDREEGDRAAQALQGLRKLSTFGCEIGVLEELGAREILDFAGRWLLDVDGLQDASEARDLMLALDRFCTWCEERQSYPLANACAGFLEGLRDSLPRMARARRECEPSTRAHRPYDVLRIQDSKVLVRDDEGREHLAAITSALGEWLAAGDLLHGRLEAARIQVSACYPGELRGLLKFRA